MEKELSQVARQPSLFISHATPMLALATSDDDAYAASLRSFFTRLMSGRSRPRAIVAVTPYATSKDSVEVSLDREPGIIHGFGGFPSSLYEMNYACAGSPEVAAQVAGLIGKANIEVGLETGRRLDPAVWIPMRTARPEADLPIVTVSMPLELGPRGVLKLGHAVRELRAEGVLIIGFGAVVYNASAVQWHGKHARPVAWAEEFQKWILERLVAKDVESLVEFQKLAPHASLVQPEPKHLYPLLFALGAAWPGDELQIIFDAIEYSTISSLSVALATPEL